MKQGSSQQFSNQLFYKVYITLVLCIILIGSVLDYFIKQADNDIYFQQLQRTYQPIMLLIGEKLETLNAEELNEEINTLSSMLNLSLSLVKQEDFAGDEASLLELSSGNTLMLYGKNNALALYRQVNNSNSVLELEIPETEIDAGLRWVPLIFYLLIAFVVFLLIRPFTKQLLKLKSATNEMGKGDFTVRLNMPETSTLYPIAKAFDTMTQKIEALILRQRDLTNAVSHELRTPLSRLKFAFEELETQVTDSNRLEDIGEMRGDVLELEKLIDEMLMYAEATQIKTYQKQPININRFITDLIQSTNKQKVNLNKSITLEINSNVVVQGDEPALFRAFSNILRNSLSFAESTCQINVYTKVEEVIIEIVDDGPGIEEKLVNRVFDPFFKINSSKRTSGYGLGLAIAKNIIKKHHGTIRIIKGNLSGACFQISIPIVEFDTSCYTSTTNS